MLHEFRSLVLFAKQDYQQSAATIHSVLALSPGWDWTTLSSMYASVPVYTEQLRALEAYSGTHPKDAASRFLLAYHYMSCGHPEASARQLRAVLKFQPQDRIASDLLRMVEPPKPELTSSLQDDAQTTNPATQIASTEEIKPITDAMLAGRWSAKRDDGTSFQLNLLKDSIFTWSHSSKGQAAQEFDGTFTLDNNTLALERKDGGTLIAHVSKNDENAFNFELLGAPDDDHGLDFSR